MPKKIHIPSSIKELNTTHINPEVYLSKLPANPIEFRYVHKITYPYTWLPGEELSFEYTLNNVPNELLIQEVHRYGDNTDPGTYPFSKISMLNGDVDISVNSIFKIGDTYYRLFSEDPEDEIINNETTSRDYGHILKTGEAFYGHSNTATSHIMHRDTSDKRIILKDFTLTDNVLKVTYLNEESTSIVLDNFLTMEPVSINYPGGLNRFEHLSISVTEDRLFMFGQRIGKSNPGSTVINNLDSEYAIFMYNKEQNATERIELPVDTIITNPQPGESYYINGCDATTNVFNSDHYFVNIICGEQDYRMLMYDSSSDTWTNKNSSFTSSDFYTRYSPSVGGPTSGRPLDTKHIASTGNVHALITCFEDTFKPAMYYSDSNMENWTKIFDEASLTSSVNSNAYGPLHIATNARSVISNYVRSKIIDENTMFSEFCSYVQNNNYFTSPAQYISNFLLKTSDTGVNWTDVMSSHPEYTFAGTTRNYISDDGNRIYSMIFYKKVPVPSGIPVGNFPTIYDEDGIVLFNYSSDGGTTWKFPSGSWSNINTTENISLFTDISIAINEMPTVGLQLAKRRCAIYAHSETNEIIAVIGNACYVSRDIGDTWENGYGAIYEHKYGEAKLQRSLLNFSMNNIDPTYLVGDGFDANDMFAAYSTYYGAETDITTPEGVYSVSDYIFESLGGGYGGYSSDYDESKINISPIFIASVNGESSIAKIKGYYI